MFKLMFRAMVSIFFIVFITVALAMWKGGEPFRWVGEGLQIMGERVEDFGDIVDEFISGSKQLQKSYNKIKDVINTDKDQ